ncbi:MAG: hypothetical protein KA974_06175 [Saprospiraceae bacterium]|nr:hypothetical protein [Saprospiraceae bacterium]MBP7680229.1 hypothetical protein [Saprospiraceae bacterium]
MRLFLKKILPFILCQIATITFAQPLVDAEKTLMDWAQEIATQPEKMLRIRAFEQFDSLLLAMLQQPKSYNYSFDSLQTGRTIKSQQDSTYDVFSNRFLPVYIRVNTGIAIVQPEDKAFRIFTYRLYVAEDDYRFGGIIQLKNGQTIHLNDASATMDILDLPYETLQPANWYGAIYYNVKSFESKSGKKYLLFGFDNYSLHSNRKITDVLTLNKNAASFGAPVFAKITTGYAEPTYQNRIILEYATDAAVRLNYDAELKCIIHDHLVPLDVQGKGNVMVTDGSYEGYNYKNKEWLYFEKLPTLILDEAPREKPILDNRKKDILGRQ